MAASYCFQLDPMTLKGTWNPNWDPGLQHYLQLPIAHHRPLVAQNVLHGASGLAKSDLSSQSIAALRLDGGRSSELHGGARKHRAGP